MDQIQSTTGELENQEAHQDERRNAAQRMEVSEILALDLSLLIVLQGCVFVVGLAPGCHVLSTAIYDDFGIKTFAFPKTKATPLMMVWKDSKDSTVASLSRKTCIRLKVGQREMCKSSFSCFALHMCVVVFILFFSCLFGSLLY